MNEKRDKKKSKFKTQNLDSQIFDREVLRIRRDKTAPQFENHDFLPNSDI